MAHNGGRWQLNLNFPFAGCDFPFANLLKQAPGVLAADYSYALPSQLSALGYALPGETIRYVLGNGIPPQTALPGNYRLKWGGTATFSPGNAHTVVSGSLSGTDGEAVLAIPGDQFGFAYTGHATDPVDDISLVHENYVASYDGGNIWNPRLIERLMELRPGILRFLDWINPNNSMARWEHRKPYGYSVWGQGEHRGSVYVTTTNVGDAFTTSGSGGVLTHGELALVRLSATPTNGSYATTLNWKGTGAKPLRALSNLALGTLVEVPAGGQFYPCVYDAPLGVWLLDGGGTISNPLPNAVPIEAIIDLCNRIGAHCWIPIPYLATDPLTDYAAELATYCQAHLDSGLKLFCEPGNEFWNTAPQYPGTWWGEYRAELAWGIAPGSGTGTRAFYNRMTANIGHAISDVFGGDRTRYAIVSATQGVAYYTQSVGDAYAENLGRYNSHVKGEDYHAESGEYAATVVTHIANTNYWSPAFQATPQEVTLSAEYPGASPTRKAEILNEYVLGPFDTPENLHRQYSGRPPENNLAWCALKFQKTRQYDTWVQIIQDSGYDQEYLSYEGGFWSDGLGLTAKNDATALRDLVRFDFQNMIDAGGVFPSQYWLSSPGWNISLLSPNIYVVNSPQYLGVLDFNGSAPTTAVAKYITTQDGRRITTQAGELITTQGEAIVATADFITTQDGRRITTQDGRFIITQGSSTAPIPGENVLVMEFDAVLQVLVESDAAMQVLIESDATMTGVAQ